MLPLRVLAQLQLQLAVVHIQTHRHTYIEQPFPFPSPNTATLLASSLRRSSKEMGYYPGHKWIVNVIFIVI